MKKRKPNFKLSAEEKKMESEIENGDWTPASDKEMNRLRLEMVDAAKNGSKDARVNLRLNPEDLEKIRLKAKREGIPYQTLIGSVLHKYATDQLIEEKAIEAIVRKLGKKVAS
jgi:predicted DNA binding CopG/RHH family protein